MSALSLLPCACCGAPGPHPVLIYRGGGFLAFCARCDGFRKPEAWKQAAEYLGDGFHGSTLRGPSPIH